MQKGIEKLQEVIKKKGWCGTFLRCHVKSDCYLLPEEHLVVCPLERLGKKICESCYEAKATPKRIKIIQKALMRLTPIQMLKELL